MPTASVKSIRPPIENRNPSRSGLPARAGPCRSPAPPSRAAPSTAALTPAAIEAMPRKSSSRVPASTRNSSATAPATRPNSLAHQRAPENAAQNPRRHAWPSVSPTSPASGR